MKFNSLQLLIVALILTSSFNLKAAGPRGTVQEPVSGQDAKNEDTFCVHNEKEVQDRKAELPEYFQVLPVALGAETTRFTTDVVVVLHIGIQNESIVLKSDIWKLGSRYQDMQEIKKVCFNPKKKEMQIKFTNNSDDLKIKYTSNDIVVQGVSLKKLTAEQKIEFTQTINKKEQKGEVSK